MSLHGAYCLTVMLLEFSLCLPDLNADVFSNFKVTTGISEQLFNANLLYTVRVRSAMDCAQECSRTPRCSGYKFLSVHLTCHTRQMLQSPRKKLVFTPFKSYMKIVDSEDETHTEYQTSFSSQRSEFTTRTTVNDQADASEDADHANEHSHQSSSPSMKSSPKANVKESSLGIKHRVKQRIIQMGQKANKTKQIEVVSSATGGVDKRICGEAPIIPFTKNHTEGYLPGNITTYTCLPDYIPCKKKIARSVCQTTGEWNAVKLLCRRFRWYNMTNDTKHFIPCGGSRDVLFTLMATPTKNTRGTVHIMRKKDVLVCMDMRLDWGAKGVDTLVLNSGYENDWQTESKNKLKLEPGKEICIIISLKNGMAEIQIGSFQVKYKCQLWNKMARYIEYYNDLKVRMLTIKNRRL